jgi:hypothetical protein
MRAVRAIQTIRNYPGRLHIPVCIIPCAQSSTANRLVPFSQQAAPPSASLSRSSSNACPPPSFLPTTTISPRLTFYSLHRFGLFRRFRPFFRQTSPSAAGHFPYEPGRHSCIIRFRFNDPCGSFYRRFRQRPSSLFRLRPHYAWLPP